MLSLSNLTYFTPDSYLSSPVFKPANIFADVVKELDDLKRHVALNGRGLTSRWGWEDRRKPARKDRCEKFPMSTPSTDPSLTIRRNGNQEKRFHFRKYLEDKTPSDYKTEKLCCSTRADGSGKGKKGIHEIYGNISMVWCRGWLTDLGRSFPHVFV